MKRNRLTFDLEEEDRRKLEEYIKAEYPRIRTYSEAIRLALRQFFLSSLKA